VKPISTKVVSPTLAVLIALTAASCSGGGDGGRTGAGDATTTSADATITVTDAWARTSAAMASSGAVYMTIENTGGADDALIDVAVDPSVAASAELHEVVMAGEMGGGASSTTMGGGASSTTMGGGDGVDAMAMREVDQIDLPSGASIVLEPGAYPVMLVGLAAPLEVGTTISMTLTFEHAAMFSVDAEVRTG